MQKTILKIAVLLSFVLPNTLTGAEPTRRNIKVCPAMVVTHDNKEHRGIVILPLPHHKKIKLLRKGIGLSDTTIKSKHIAYIEAWAPGIPEKRHRFIYTRSLKMSPKTKETKVIKWGSFWLLCSGEGPHLKAFILAHFYGINNDGTEALGAYLRVTTPSNFSLFVQRKVDNLPLLLGRFSPYGGGGLSFNHGVKNVLYEDPLLCKYIEDNNLTALDIEEIVQRYNPESKLDHIE